MAEKLSELKEKLSSMGISTNTPGLRGKERLEELRNRLEDALCADEPQRAGMGFRGGEAQSIRKVVEGLTSAQIRENLNLLGQNTNTPGLNGEDRREELIRRLIAAVESANMTGTFVEELETRAADGQPQPRGQGAVGSNSRGPDGDSGPDGKLREAKQASSAAAPVTEQDGPEWAELRRLADQRSRMIQMRLQPGPHQESGLRELDALLLQVMAEIDFLQTNRSKDKFRKESSVLIADGEPMAVGRLLGLLAQRRAEVQEKMEARRQQVIDSENSHPVYGLAVEQQLRAAAAGERDISRQAEASVSSLRERVGSVKERYGPDGAAREGSAGESKRSSAAAAAPAAPGKATAAPAAAPVLRQRDDKPRPPAEEKPRPAGAQSKAAESKAALPPQQSSASSSSSDDDDGELPPLQPQPVPPPPADPPREDKRTSLPEPEPEPERMSCPDDSLGPLTVVAPEMRRPAPLSALSEAPTDSTFRTDFSPTAEVAAGKGDRRPLRGGAIDVKSVHRSNAAAAGLKPPARGGDREVDREGEEDHDMYAEDSEEGEGERDMAAGQHTGSAAVAAEDLRRIKELRLSARRLERAHRTDEAEAAYLQALEVDPTDIRTLDKYAIFLHRRRGELPRAAAFFRRAIQECVPSLLQPRAAGDRSPHTAAAVSALPPDSPPPRPTHGSGAMRSDAVTQVLLHYGRFLQRAQGDMALAEDVFRKAVQVSPDSASAQGSLGRFLSGDPVDARGLDPHSDEARRCAEAEECFARALRIEPDNVTHLLWYAKLLKNSRKIAQADVMYSAALKRSSAGGKHAALEPTAMCNYASFLLKYRHDAARAEELFQDGLERFPKHKGLVRNYKHFSKAAAKKRARAPPTVPADIDEILARRDEKLADEEERRHPAETPIAPQREAESEEAACKAPRSCEGNGRDGRGDDQGDGCGDAGGAKQSDERGDERDAKQGDEAQEEKRDSGAQEEKRDSGGQEEARDDEQEDYHGLEDGSVVSALTCQFSDERPEPSAKPQRPRAELMVEFDAFLSVPGMYCAGITECREGGSKPVPLDMSDSVVSMTVAVKPGSWRWVKDLSANEQGVHSTTVCSGDEDEGECTQVNLRSSMIVSVHHKSRSDPSGAVMLGFVVLTMTAVLSSPQIEDGVYLVERSFSSDRFSVDPADNSERRSKVAGKLKLCLRVDISQGDEDEKAW